MMENLHIIYCHRKKDVPKTYYAHVAGVVTEDDIEEFRSGVMLDDGYVTKPGKLKILFQR